ncbi:MAG: hypothetical protein ACP59X_02395 [Solidesulfovibrio sp. DCME]|uniref:hypothetical protein n=1 Tax=Solidesulfovibrio sp. DCME TaxID=3447380 RepID=UPI003D10D591
MSRAGKAVRVCLWSGLGLVVLAVAALIWFGAWHYPALGLAGIPKGDPARAMDLAVRGMTAADGLTFEDWDFRKFRSVQRGGEAYAWGAARCRTAAGATTFYWVYLEWSNKRGQWLRNYSLELAAPDDELYFTRTFPGQVERARLALSKLVGQLRSHLRETRAFARNPQGLQTPGL